MPQRAASSRPPTDAPPPIQSAVYVPLVHGIGVGSHEDWTNKSLKLLVAWWTSAERPACARELADCPRNCALAKDHHVHLVLERGDRAAQVDIETLFWADRVDRPSKREAAALVLKAGSLVGLVDLAAAAAARSERIPEPDTRPTVRYAVDTSQFAFSWLRLAARALLTPLLALGVAVGCLFETGHRTLGDALSWGRDAQTRNEIKRHVTHRLAARGGGARLLIGHSMGGAVLAEIVRDLRQVPRNDRLMTLGSGAALLSALDVLAPQWSPRRVGTAWLAVYLGLAGSCYLIASFLFGLIGPLVYGLFRLILDAPADADAFTEGIEDWILGWPIWPAPFALAAAVASVFIVAGVIGERDQLLRRTIRTSGRNKPSARGIDVLASHDPVSAALVELGERRRVNVFAQTRALGLDHTSYFRNGCAVLPLIAAEVERMTGLRQPGQDAEDATVAAYHRWGLAFGKRTFLVCGLVLAGLEYALVRESWSVLGAGAIALALVVVGALGASWWGMAWLRRCSRLAAASATTLGERETARGPRLDSRFTLLLSLVAALLLGPFTPSHHAPGLVLGAALAIAAWLSAFGARGADALATTAAIAAAGLWLTHPDGEGVSTGPKIKAPQTG